MVKNTVKIIIPYSTNYKGGTGTFVQEFSKFSQPAHEVRQGLMNDANAMLAITSIPLALAYQAHRFRIPIIQRLDGVVSWSTFPRPWYPLLNAKMNLTHRFFADGVIYQSEFSERCCRKMLGRSKTKKTVIIYNGVDRELFSPVGERHAWGFDQRPDVVAITTGRFRRPDQLEPIVKAVDAASKKVSIRLVIVGQIKNNLATALKGLSYITLTGLKRHYELPFYLRSADLFLFSDRSACPNAVLEAMACGLPIVAYGRGAIRELIEDGVSGRVVGHHGDEFWRNESFDHTGYADAIGEVLKNRTQYSKNARQQAVERFEIREMVEKYIHFIQNIQ